MRASLYPLILFNADDVPTYLYGIAAGWSVVVLVVVSVAIVGVVVRYRVNKVYVVKKVSTNIMQIAMRAEMSDTVLAHH